jgi:hypothetical protein
MAFIGLPWPTKRTGWRDDDDDEGVGLDADMGTSGVATSRGWHPVATRAALPARKERRDQTMVHPNHKADCSPLLDQ